MNLVGHMFTPVRTPLYSFSRERVHTEGKFDLPIKHGDTPLSTRPVREVYGGKLPFGLQRDHRLTSSQCHPSSYFHLSFVGQVSYYWWHWILERAATRVPPSICDSDKAGSRSRNSRASSDNNRRSMQPGGVSNH